MSERVCKDVILRDGEGIYLLPRAWKDTNGNIIKDHIENKNIHITSQEKNMLKPATSTTLGVIKLGSDVVETSTKAYPLQVNNSNQAVISITCAVAPSTSSDGQDGLMSKEDKAKLDSIINTIYPVGCIFSSVNNVTPTFGDTTWTAIASLSNPTVYRWQRTS